MRSILFVLPGMLFGAGLAISGMTNPGKVIGFLDIAGKWDPSLALVMVGAIGAFAVLNRVIHRRPAPLLGGTLPGPRALGELDRRLVAGAVLFGVGWALAGVCPGPGLVNLSRPGIEQLVFVVAMTAGVLIAQHGFGVDAPG